FLPKYNNTDYDNTEELDACQDLENESYLIEHIPINNTCQVDHDSNTPLLTEELKTHFFKKITSKIKSRTRMPNIWEFMVRLLLHPVTNPSLVAWEHKKKHIFRLMKPHELSDLWNSRVSSDKNLPYSSFARALRYWYSRGGLRMIKERQLLYRMGPRARSYLQKLQGDIYSHDIPELSFNAHQSKLQGDIHFHDVPELSFQAHHSKIDANCLSNLNIIVGSETLSKVIETKIPLNFKKITSDKTSPSCTRDGHKRKRKMSTTEMDSKSTNTSLKKKRKSPKNNLSGNGS
ncbi:unnamed protein product, partial [Meganyctiphanes norvegica]